MAYLVKPLPVCLWHSLVVMAQVLAAPFSIKLHVCASGKTVQGNPSTWDYSGRPGKMFWFLALA